jgi:hypothetical protein
VSTGQTSPNWSGFVLSGGPFNEVWGDWHVPWIIFGETGIVDKSSFWVGIDGYTSSPKDVVQAGTEQMIFEFEVWSFTFYYAWVEIFPQPEQVISNLPVNPGDEMFVVVIFTGSTAYFLVENLTINEYVLVPMGTGGTVVSATSVEWIMERPSFNGTLTDLACYAFAGMRDAFASLPSSGPASYQGVNLGTGTLPSLSSFQITMQNGSDVLSVVQPLDEFSMFFAWRAFH